MARRYRQQRTTPLEDVILFSNRLPWWACLLLALITYLVLHSMASRPLITNQVGPGQMGDVVVSSIFRTMAMFGQLVVPVAFCIAAIISAFNEYRKKQSSTINPSHLKIVPPSKKRASTEVRNRTQIPDNYNSVVSTSDFKHELIGEELAPVPEDLQPISMPQTWSESVLQMIEWKRFEIVTREFLNMTGYEAHETNVGADGGVDIRVTKPGNSSFRGIVQCKAWNAYRVGVKPVRELYGVMAAEKVTAGMLITSGAFTAEAEEFAKGKVRLISGVNFLELIRKLPMEKQRQLLEIALEGDFQTPTCPQCDVKMTLRENKSGKNAGSKFWGCVRYPRCRQTLVYGET